MTAHNPHRDSPYQGLVPYSEDDANFFFGRERETRLIIANLFASPLTLLYGASGVGKSSVLRAGVARQLRQRDDLLVVVFNAWQGEALRDLRAVIAQAVQQLTGKEFIPSASANLAEYLTECSIQLNRRLMIILDQFEEYFLYHPQEDDFSRELPQAVMITDAPVSFLISLREDALAKLDRFEGRIPILFDNYLRVEHLSLDAGREAILKPIEQYNLLAADKPRVSIEPELVETVLGQVKTGEVVIGEPGQGIIRRKVEEQQIETPYLQLVMMRIWGEEMRKGSSRLRLKTLHELGGAQNIVRTHLDTAMSALSTEAQDIAAKVFNYLVTPSGAKIAHTIPDLAKYAEVPKAKLLSLIEDLLGGDVRILRGVASALDQADEPRYEIFHDVLAPAILAWRAKHGQGQELAEAKRTLAKQRRRTVRLGIIAGVFIILSLLMGALAIYAFNQQRAAAVAGAEAKQQRDIAREATARAELEQSKATQAKLLADRQRDEAEKQADAAQKAETEADAQKQVAFAERRRAEEQKKLAESRLITAEEERRKAQTANEELQAKQSVENLSREGDEALARGEKERAITLFRRVVELALEKQDYIGAASTLRTMGSIYNIMGEDKKALEVYAFTRVFFQQQGFRSSEAVILENIGDIHLNLGERHKALEYFMKTLALREKLGEQNELASIMDRIGDLNYDLGEKQEAIKYYTKALDIRRKMKDRWREAMMLSDLAGTYNSLGDTEHAIKYYEDALAIRRDEFDAPTWEAATLKDIGRIYEDLRQNQKAIDYYDKALVIYREAGHRDEAASMLFSLGSICEYIGEMERARLYFRDAVPLYKEAGDRASEADSLTHIAGIHSYFGENEKALRYYMQALELRTELKDSLWQGALLENIGEIYDDAGKKTEALEYYRRAYDCYQAIDFQSRKANALSRIGRVYDNLDDKQEALMYYSRALEISQRSGDKYKAISMLDLISDIYNDTGEMEKSVNCLEQILSMKKTFGVPRGEASTLNEIGRAYYIGGDDQKAIQYYLRAATIFKDVRERVDEVNVLINLGKAYSASGNKKKAEEYFKEAATSKKSKRLS